MDAVGKYGWPSRVRGDFGTENNGIEARMVDHWGILHRAYLRGRYDYTYMSTSSFDILSLHS